MRRLIIPAAIAAALLSLIFIELPFRLLIVTGGSMAPTLQKGDLAATVSIEAGDILEGDIIAYQAPQNKKTIVIHRVIEAEKGKNVKLLVKGDGNRFPDPWTIEPSWIIGKAVASLPLLGFAVYLVKTPLGYVAAILLPFLWIAFDMLELPAKRPSRKGKPVGSM